MTAEEILNEVRGLLDDTVLPYLWSDETLIGYLNHAVDEICERTRVIQDSTSKVTSIPLVAGQARYTLDPSIYAVRRVNVTGQRNPLTLTTASYLDDRNPGWDDNTLTNAGTAECAVFDLGDGTITLHPRPAAAGVLRLTVWRRPTDTERIEALDDDPAVPERTHRELIHFVLYRAYSTSDSELRNDEKAGIALGQFTANVGVKPSLHAMRQWSTSKITGTRPHWF